jgi:PAS domain S-box-containing protein
MKTASLSSNEAERLKRVESFAVLDTEAEEQFDSITRAIAKLFDVKHAAISVLDKDRFWVKSSFGFPLKQVSRCESLCELTIQQREIFFVPDAKKDPRFQDNSLVQGDPGLRFYAGYPLFTSDGFVVGTIAVFDSDFKTPSSAQLDILKTFAQTVVAILELRETNNTLKSISKQYEDVQTMVQAGAWELVVATGETIWSSQIYEIYQIPQGTPTNTVDGLSYYAVHEQKKLSSLIGDCINHKTPFDDVFEFKDAKGIKKWVRSIGRAVLGKNGKLEKIVGTFQDVTLQVKKEKNLDLVIHNISEGYFDWDLTTNYEFISSKFWKILGYDPATKAHSPDEWQAILHPDDMPKVMSAHEKHFTSRGVVPYEVELRMLRADGQYVWIRVYGKVIEWSEAGAPLRMVGTGREIQKERELLEKIQDSNRHLDLAVEGGNIGIWDWDLRDNGVRFSPRWASLRGVTLADLKMDLSDWESRVHPDDLKAAYAHINDYLSGKTAFFEHLHRVRHSDGRWLYIFGRGRFSEWDDLGKPTRFTGTDMDLTELMATKQNLNQFFSLSLNYLCMANTKGYFTKINSTWLSLGYSESELLSRPFIDFVHPNDLADTLLETKKLSDGQTTTKFENRYLKKNGQYIHLEWAATLDPDSGLIFAAATDVTERRKREDITQILSDVRSKFIEYSGDKKKFFDYLLDKIITLTSSQYGFVGEILGSGEEKYLKTFSLTDISWNAETKAFFEKHNAAGLEFRNLSTLFGEVIKTGELLITNDAPHHPKANGIPKGHPPLDTFMGVPLSYNGQAFAMIGVANNRSGYRLEDYQFLTPFFELVGEMIQTIKLSEELENQRRLSLHNAKLASIGELAAGVGHEINNPLAIILGQIEMLRMRLEAKGELDASFESFFTKMIRGIDRISSIVKGLRTFARMDKNEMVHFDFKELLTETVEMLEEIYRTDGIAIGVQLPEKLLTYGNRGRLQQVLVNLLNNARDAMVNSIVKKLSIEAQVLADKIILRITDTGSGVSPSLREKIFEPFFTTKEVNKGTGIGLSLALSIIRDHQGELSLEQPEHSGTTFVISLPFSQPSTSVQVTKNPPAPVIQPMNELAKVGTVLVVDDETDIRELLVFFLEQYKLEVLSASSAQEALGIYQKHQSRINLVISDMKMPGMSGAELAVELRGQHAFTGGFYLVTGGVNFSEGSLPQEIHGIISKPFSHVQFQKIVKEWCSKSSK